MSLSYKQSLLFVLFSINTSFLSELLTITFDWKKIPNFTKFLFLLISSHSLLKVESTSK